MFDFVLDFLQILVTIAMLLMRVVPIFYDAVSIKAFMVVVSVYFVTLVIDSNGKGIHGLSVGQAFCLLFFLLDYLFNIVFHFSNDQKVVTWAWLIIAIISIVLNGAQMWQRWNNRGQ
jgi:hypothetical protein